MSTTTNAPTTFNPTDFFGSNWTNPNYSEFNPLYTTDSSASGNQLSLLQDALQYVQGNPAGMSQSDAAFYAQQLQADIAEQQNVGTYDSTITNYNNVTSQLAQDTAQAQNWSGSQQQGGDTSTWGAIQQNAQGLANWLIQNPQQASQLASQNVGQSVPFLQAFQGGAQSLANYFMTADTTKNPIVTDAAINAYYNQSLIPSLQAQQQTLSGQQNTANSNLLNNVTMTNPNYADEMNAVNQYYYGNGTAANPGVISSTTTPELQSIYQQNYNQRNGINEQMAASGNLGSGVRQQDLANQNSLAINDAAQVVAGANSQAQSSIGTLGQQNLGAQAQQNELLTGLQQGGASGLLSGATNSAIQNYDTNTQAQQQNAIQSATTGVAQNSLNNSSNSNIAGSLGSSLGTLGGTNSSSFSNPFGMFSSMYGATI